MSSRQNKKQDQRLKAVAKTITEGIDLSGMAKEALKESANSLSAVDLIHGIKESWSDEEIDELCVWFEDKEAGRWG